MIKSKDALRVREFNITMYKKGFTSICVIDNIKTMEYFQFKEIQQIIHYSNTGVEIVFYNDIARNSQIIFDTLNNSMILWMDLI